MDSGSKHRKALTNSPHYLTVDGVKGVSAGGDDEICPQPVHGPCAGGGRGGQAERQAAQRVCHQGTGGPRQLRLPKRQQALLQAASGEEGLLQRRGGRVRRGGGGAGQGGGREAQAGSGLHIHWRKCGH